MRRPDIAGMFLALKAFSLRNVDVLIKDRLKKGIVNIHQVDLVAHEDGVGKEEM